MLGTNNFSTVEKKKKKTLYMKVPAISLCKCMFYKYTVSNISGWWGGYIILPTYNHFNVKHKELYKSFLTELTNRFIQQMRRQIQTDAMRIVEELLQYNNNNNNNK